MDAEPLTSDGPSAERARAASWRAGLRDGMPFAVASLLLAISFGVLARHSGFSAAAAIIMSFVVFAGSAQFAAVSILAAGGSAASAIGAAALMNSRFFPMGIAIGPSLPGGRVRRALQGQAVVDASWAMAAQGGGRFDRWFLFGATAVQYVGWQAGTIIGVFGGSLIGNTDALGLDAVYPAFFLSLLYAELRNKRSRGVALAGAVIALALVPITPAGVPVLAASAAAIIGLRTPRSVRPAPVRPDPDPGAGA